MTLKKVGYFFELPRDSCRKQLEALRRGEEAPNEREMLGYLDAGVPCAAVLLMEEDVLAPSPAFIGAPNIHTDGVWAWPATLPYYVRKYHIELPSEFVSHMQANNWKCPQNVDTTELEDDGEVVMG